MVRLKMREGHRDLALNGRKLAACGMSKFCSQTRETCTEASDMANSPSPMAARASVSVFLVVFPGMTEQKWSTKERNCWK